jgi:hypothetical protein
MKMRVRLIAIFASVCFCAVGADGVPVESVVATVRTAIAKKRKDAATAAALDKLKLTQHLEDRVLEILESEGAGPQTLGALQRLRDASRLLPAPTDAPPGMAPPPPPSAEEEERAWRETAAKSQDYNRSLPNFLCTEIIHRWMDPTGQEAWQSTPTVVMDVSYFERKEQYSMVSVGGKRSTQSIAELDGAFSQGEFGTMLANLFDVNMEADHVWDHWTILRKRPTSVFFFRVPVGRHPHELNFRQPGGTLRTEVGLYGYVYIDRETERVTRISATAEDIPRDFPVTRSYTVLDYDFADIAGERYLLPLRAEVRVDAGKLQGLNSVEFQKYRKFVSDTSISFGKN